MPPVHPILGNRFLLALFAVASALSGLLLAGLLANGGERGATESLLLGMPIAMGFGVLGLSAWFVCQAAPAGRAAVGRIAAALAGSALASSVLGTAAAAGWARVLAFLATHEPLHGWLPGPAPGAFHRLSQNDVALLFGAGVILYLVSAALHYLMLELDASRRAERLTLEARLTAREAELRSLRSQLDPHFLFNSLNTIASLAGSDPAAARRACILLGEFLRSSLRLGAQPAVPLSEELALVRGYLAVEQVRFGRRLAVEERIDPAASSCPVPPLLLQPLVENAIHHGIATLAEGGTLVIQAVRDGDRLRITIENPRDAESPPTRGTGIGLANVRARLQVWAAAGGQLLTRQTDDGYRAEVFLPAEGVADRLQDDKAATGASSPGANPRADGRLAADPLRGPAS